MNQKIIKREYELLLLFFSIEYLGNDSISVYKVILFPLSCLCLFSMFNMQKNTNYKALSIKVSVLFLWLALCQIITNNNPLFPIFTIPFALCVISFMNLKEAPTINYPLIFSLYSVPHIISFLTGIYSLDAGRFCGLHKDPNFCGIFLCVSIAGAIFFVLDKNNNKLLRYFQILNILISSYLVFWSGSRGAILSFLLIIVYYFYTNKKIHIVIKLLLTIAIIYLYNGLSQYINSLPSWVDPDTDLIGSIMCRFQSDNLQDGSHRTYLWEVAFKEMFDNNAYLTPIGSAFAMRYTPNSYAHNLYIDYMLEMGFLVGLIFDVWIMYCISKTLRLISKTDTQTNDRILGFISVVILFQLFFLSAYTEKFSWLFVILILCLSNKKYNVLKI